MALISYRKARRSRLRRRSGSIPARLTRPVPDRVQHLRHYLLSAGPAFRLWTSGICSRHLALHFDRHGSVPQRLASSPTSASECGSRQSPIRVSPRLRLGGGGSALVNICQCLNFFLFSVYALVVIGSSLSQTGTSVCQNGWIGVIAALLVPFVQIPSFEQLSFLGIVYAILTLVSLVILVQQSATEGICDGNDRDYDSISAFSVLSGAVTFGFAFSGSGVFPELISEMADKREFHGVFGSLTLSWLVIVPVNLPRGHRRFRSVWEQGERNRHHGLPARRSEDGCCRLRVIPPCIRVLLESNQVLAPQVGAAFWYPGPGRQRSLPGSSTTCCPRCRSHPAPRHPNGRGPGGSSMLAPAISASFVALWGDAFNFYRANLLPPQTSSWRGAAPS